MRDALNNFGADAMSTLRGLGRGATAGLIKYPAAGLMMLIDKVMAENPQLSFEQAVKLIDEQRAADRATVGGKVGEIAGAFVPSGALLRTGAGIAKAAGLGAAQGAAAGFSEQESLSDAALGAGLGAAGGVVGGALAKGQTALTKNQLQDVLRGQTQRQTQELLQTRFDLDNVKNLIKAERAAGRSTSGLEMQRTMLQKSANGLKSSQAQNQRLLQQLPKMTDEQVIRLAGGNSIVKDAIKGHISGLTGRTVREAVKATGVPTGVLAGVPIGVPTGAALLGGAAGMATGQDPLAMAAMAAGGTVLARAGMRPQTASSPIIAAKTGALPKVGITPGRVAAAGAGAGAAGAGLVAATRNTPPPDPLADYEIVTDPFAGYEVVQDDDPLAGYEVVK